MAFTPFANLALDVRIREIHNIYYRSSTNLLQRCTIGLAQLCNEITASSAFAGSVTDIASNVSDKSGRLIICRSMPLLAKRYVLEDLIGEGTFSQIFQTTDIFTNRQYAIKVMRVGFQTLGIRESVFLRHFTSLTKRGPKYCKILLADAAVLNAVSSSVPLIPYFPLVC
jgi:serine/threonine protein kinase